MNMPFNSFSFRTRRTPLVSTPLCQVLVLVQGLDGRFYAAGQDNSEGRKYFTFEVLDLFMCFGGRVELCTGSGFLHFYTQLSHQEVIDLLQESELAYGLNMHCTQEVLHHIRIIREGSASYVR